MDNVGRQMDARVIRAKPFFHNKQRNLLPREQRQQRLPSPVNPPVTTRRKIQRIKLKNQPKRVAICFASFARILREKFRLFTGEQRIRLRAWNALKIIRVTPILFAQHANYLSMAYFRFKSFLIEDGRES